MAPVVHGLAKDYAGRIDFLYLDTSDPRNAAAKRQLGFVSTPHFFFLRPDGTKVMEIRGVAPSDSVVAALARILSASARVGSLATTRVSSR